MAFYQPVKPGEPVKHSARRENDISALLNHFNGISAVSTRAGMGSAFKIAVCNRTQAVIPAGYAVEIDPDAVPSAEAVPVKLATTSSDFYQVTTENMQPGDISSAICMGVATVQLSATLPEGTRYVEPGTDGLFQAATGGRAQVISTKEKTATILLGAGGTGYNGYFKVIDASEAKDDGTKTLKIKVVDGADPAAASCGIATVNSVEVVIQAKTVDVEKKTNVQYVYCSCSINSANQISGTIEISSTRPARQSDSTVTKVIGRIFYENNSMRIVQDQFGEIWMPYMLECPGRES